MWDIAKLQSLHPINRYLLKILMKINTILNKKRKRLLSYKVNHVVMTAVHIDTQARETQNNVPINIKLYKYHKTWSLNRRLLDNYQVFKVQLLNKKRV